VLASLRKPPHLPNLVPGMDAVIPRPHSKVISASRVDGRDNPRINPPYALK
jgi:hypothetical protein